MPDGLEARLRWLFGGVAVVLVATGAFALLVTSTTEPAQVSTEAQLRALVAAMLAGATAAFAVVGARIVWAPRRSTHLMPVLALAGFAGFACEAVAALQAWRAAASWAEPAYVAGASLALALASVVGWLALWLAERPGVATARRDAALFDALLATLVPPGEGLELDARDPAVAARVVAAFAARSTKRRPALRLALRTLDAAAIVKHRSRFDAAGQALRERIVAGLATSRRPRLRALGARLNEIVLGAFWDDERIRLAVGDDAARLQTLLESGPNAAAHRARREAAEQAAAAAALAAEALANGTAASGEDAVRAVEAEAPSAAAPVDDAESLPDAPPRVAAHADDAAPAAAPAAGRAAPKSAPMPAADGPKEIAPHTEELPFDRPWTLGVPAQEATPRPAMGPVLRVARAGGPTRR